MERHHEFRIESFVFPDGTSVEMLVFDGAGDAAPVGSYHVRGAGTRGAQASANGAPGQTGVAPRVASSSCAVPPPASTVRSGREARVCPLCGSAHVYPLDWQRRGQNTWALLLRCPNCETHRDVVMDRPAVEQLNRELYQAHKAVEEQSRETSRRNFREEAERIVAALASGLIQPMDF